MQASLLKGRYSPINYYISDLGRLSGVYNDRKYTVNKSFKRTLKRMLKANGLDALSKDEALLNHFAYLFIRENPVVFEQSILEFRKGQKGDDPRQWVVPEKLEDDEGLASNSDIFEAFQSTNYHNVRFKPSKTFESNNSWLVEFRPLDIPITSREKFHLIYFVSLLQRVITDPKLFTNFHIPISRADQNMLRSVKRNAVVEQKFFFRRHFFGEKARDDQYKPKSRSKKDVEAKRKLFIQKEMVEVTVEELLLGGPNRQGIKGLLEEFVSLNEEFLLQESERTAENIIDNIWKCFDFFLKRSQGKLLTSAALVRKFVREHPFYCFDSLVQGQLADDLIEFVLQVQNDNYHQSLFG